MGKQGDVESIKEVYGCVVLGQFAAQALLLNRTSQVPTAVMDGMKPWEQVCAVNAAAHQLGILAGMSRVEVEMFGGVMTRRSKADELTAAAAVLKSLMKFSPRVEIHTDASVDWAAVLDFSGAQRLMGRANEIGDGLLEALKQLGFHALVVVASNADAGLSLARFAAARGLGQESPVLRCQVVEEDGLHDSLRNLPVGVLGLDNGQAERFEAWGIRTLGELGALREEDLIVRMGQAGRTLRARARGEFRELMQPLEEPIRLEEIAEFDHALDTLDQALFCLNSMLEKVLTRAEERALAVVLIELFFTLETSADRVEGDMQKQPPKLSQRQIQPAVATLDRALLLKLIQLDMESNALPGPIVRIELRAHAGDPSRIQLGLFAPQMPEPTRFEDTYARLSAIVGEANLGRLSPVDTHARERFELERFLLPPCAAQAVPRISQNTAPAMALRRMRPPAELIVQTVNRQIESFIFETTRYRVTRRYGPWRTSGAWWTPEAWSYDAWDIAARNESGEVLLCMLGFDLLRKRWQMEGLYD